MKNDELMVVFMIVITSDGNGSGVNDIASDNNAAAAYSDMLNYVGLK